MPTRPRLTTGAGRFFFFSFAEYPAASGLRSRSGYFGGVGCRGELHSLAESTKSHVRVYIFGVNANCYLEFLNRSFFVMVIHQQRSCAYFELSREIIYKGTGSPMHRSENWEGLVQVKRGDRFQASRAYWLACWHGAWLAAPFR